MSGSAARILRYIGSAFANCPAWWKRMAALILLSHGLMVMAPAETHTPGIQPEDLYASSHLWALCTTVCLVITSLYAALTMLVRSCRFTINSFMAAYQSASLFSTIRPVLPCLTTFLYSPTSLKIPAIPHTEYSSHFMADFALLKTLSCKGTMPISALRSVRLAA